jgi:hypothetical protein
MCVCMCVRMCMCVCFCVLCVCIKHSVVCEAHFVRVHKNELHVHEFAQPAYAVTRQNAKNVTYTLTEEWTSGQNAKNVTYALIKELHQVRTQWMCASCLCHHASEREVGDVRINQRINIMSERDICDVRNSQRLNIKSERNDCDVRALIEELTSGQNAMNVRNLLT